MGKNRGSADTPGTWDHAHDKLAMRTRGHGQTHARFISEDDDAHIHAITYEAGQPVFSLFSICVEDPKCFQELHLSLEAARIIAAFITELDPGPAPPEEDP